MIADKAGNLYGTTGGGGGGFGTVFKVAPNGTVSPFASGLNNPNGVVIDFQGNLDVADFNNQRIVTLGVNAPATQAPASR